MEPLLQQGLIAAGIKPEKLGGAVGAIAEGFPEADQQIETEDLFAEVPLSNTKPRTDA